MQVEAEETGPCLWAHQRHRLLGLGTHCDGMFLQAICVKNLQLALYTLGLIYNRLIDQLVICLLLMCNAN